MDTLGGDVSEEVLEASRFWVQRVLVPLMVCIGSVGNVVTVMVLTRKRMRSSTNIYLSALAIADIFYLLFVFILSFKHYANIHDGKYELYWRFYGLSHWFCDAASSTSVWLTVSFTIERYIAVCHPIKGKVFCTERRAKSVIIVVLMFCILTTASTTFEYQLSLNDTCLEECKPAAFQTGNSPTNSSTTVQRHLRPDRPSSDSDDKLIGPILDDSHFRRRLVEILANCTSHPHVIYVPVFRLGANLTYGKITDMNLVDDPGAIPLLNGADPDGRLEKPPDFGQPPTIADTNVTGDNTTCCKKKFMIYVENTKLGANLTYTTFIYWYSAIVFYILPLILISTFNCFLMRAVYVSQKTRRQMTNSNSHSHQDSICLSNEKRITLMLIGVVIMFIICHTPTASILIYKSFYEPETKREENITLILGNFFNFLSLVNASCNFLLYCVMSKKFRATFTQIFFECRNKRQDAIMLSSTKSKNSQKFNPYKHGLMRRNASEYHTPRNLETTSLTSVPRSKSLIVRPIGKAKSADLIV